jgi:hypothetical protein
MTSLLCLLVLDVQTCFQVIQILLGYRHCTFTILDQFDLFILRIHLFEIRKISFNVAKVLGDEFDRFVAALP